MVRRRAWTRAALGPTPGDLVLLADAGLVGEPDLYGGRLDALLAPDLVQARGKAFFNSLDRALSLLVMTGTSRELTISHGAQFPAQCLLGDDDAEFLEDPLAEVDDPPAHDAMHGRDRAALEYRGERGAVRAVQTRRLSGRLAINQPFRPMGVELHHPIANDLERHPADLRRLGPARAFVNRRQRQKPPGLRPILRPLRGGPNHPRIKISPKWNGHGEPPVLATLNQTHADSGIPLRVTLTELRY